MAPNTNIGLTVDNTYNNTLSKQGLLWSESTQNSTNNWVASLKVCYFYTILFGKQENR